MGKYPEYPNPNHYFRCRRTAAEHNDSLASRESAADLLGVSVSSLADYETGKIKAVPPHIVNSMAKFYGIPELRFWYCRNECPLGECHSSMAYEITSIERVTVQLLSALDDELLTSIRRNIIDVASNGCIDHHDIPVLDEVVDKLETLATIISELALLCQKAKEDAR